MEPDLNIFCVNCGSSSGSMVLNDQLILHCIQEWTAPRLVEPHDLVCTTCWIEAQETTRSEGYVGRSCVLCNVPLPPRIRSHQIIALRTDNQHQVNIRNIILEKLIPLQVRASHHICHPCWQRADRAAKHYSRPATSSASTSAGRKQLRCVNCGINILRMRRHILNDHLILVQVQERVAPQEVTTSDYICDACHRIFAGRDVSITSQDAPLVGHQNLCLKCGCSLEQGRVYAVQSQNNRHILHIVQNWIQPQQIRRSHLLCHKCYQRAEAGARATSQDVQGDQGIDPAPQSPEPRMDHQPQQVITLPNYCRAPDTHSRCIFRQCSSSSQRMVPYVIRVRLLVDHKYYIPPTCRICAGHLEAQQWTDLIEVENTNHNFTSTLIEDMCELLISDRIKKVDFENIDEMDDNLVWYLVGRTKQQFRELEAELGDFPNRATALGAYLIKLRTGDSNDRIAKLLDMARSTLTKLMNKARDVMCDVASCKSCAMV